MGGITGCWGGSRPEWGIGERMARRIENRGSDDADVWSDAGAGLALVHRRLVTRDHSPTGLQPMHSPCGRYVLVFNGEIYNHRDLRAKLETEGGAFKWRGYSSIETLLAGLRHWGVERCLQKLNGTFAFALWDASEQALFLARDRMGEKPLYYGRSKAAFLFGSKLKALRAHPDWKGEIDRGALSLYMRYKCVPTPWSIYQGICKLPPAHFVVISDAGQNIGEPQCYWDLAAIAEQGVALMGGDAGSLVEELETLLLDAVGRRMTADVPTGAFLSGGYDSTMIVALMQLLSDRPVKTFSIGFHEAGYNEAEHAKAVAAHLGTDHSELYVTTEQAIAVVPSLPEMNDEPFGGSSLIPTYLVSQLAREQVVVSLSGDGGDELFAGYNRHVAGSRIWECVSRIPLPLRRAVAVILRGLALGDEHLGIILPRFVHLPQLGQKFDKLASALNADSGFDFYKDLVSVWKSPERVVLGAPPSRSLVDCSDDQLDLPGLRERMLFWDMSGYLPDEILTKVSRASMAVGLKTRVPLLDHRLVEFAWKVPSEYKVRNGRGKWLLREVLYRYVPPELLDRPKQGFALPVDHWLRGPLRDWAETLLDESRLRAEGFLDPEPIRRAWSEHVTGKRQQHNKLWQVLMFQAWLENWK